MCATALPQTIRWIGPTPQSLGLCLCYDGRADLTLFPCCAQTREKPPPMSVKSAWSFHRGPAYPRCHRVDEDIVHVQPRRRFRIPGLPAFEAGERVRLTRRFGDRDERARSKVRAGPTICASPIFSISFIFQKCPRTKSISKGSRATAPEVAKRAVTKCPRAISSWLRWYERSRWSTGAIRPGSRRAAFSAQYRTARILIEVFRFAGDSPLEGSGFEPVWGFSCQAVVLDCADRFLFGAGKAVFRPVACDQVRGARGRGQGTETVAQLGGLPPSVACVSQRLDA
jgi:hypothetical protein